MNKTMPAIVGFIGTPRGLTRSQKDALARLLSAMRIVQFHHGQSAGADAAAHEIASALGICIVLHPSTSPGREPVKMQHVIRTEEPCAAMERNRRIVHAADLLIAAPPTLEEQVRKSNGTWELWATIRYARSVLAPVVILDP